MCLNRKDHTLIDQPSFSLSHKLDLNFNICCYEDYSPNLCNITTDDELNIMHFNVRGLLNKQLELHDLMTNCGGRTIHVACLNETWLTDTNKSHVSLKGYTYTGKEQVNKKGGGVGFLISDKLKFRRRDDLIEQMKTFEFAVIELKLCKETLLIVSIYRPPNTPISAFVEEYSLCWKSLNSFAGNVIICMDQNLDLLKSDCHRQTEAFVDLNLECELYPCIMQPTHITKTSATLIDNIFVNSKLHDLSTASIMIHDMSDHLPCIVSLSNMYPLMNERNHKEIRNIPNQNLIKIKQSLEETDWSEIIDMTSTNSAFISFSNIVERLVEKNTETRQVNQNKIKPYRSWLGPSIRKCMTKCQRLYKRTLSQNASINNHMAYKEYRNVLIRVLIMY